MNDRSLISPPIDRRRILKLAAAAPLALSGSLAHAAVSVRPARYELEPTAGRWKPWQFSPSQLPGAPPPPGRAASLNEAKALLTLQAQRSDLVRSLVRFWDDQGGVPTWTNILLEKIRVTNTNPVLASRAMALLQTAMADAAIAAWQAKYRYTRLAPSRSLARLRSISRVTELLPSYPSEHAAVSAAAATVLNYLFAASPDDVIHGQALTFDQMAAEASQSRLYAGANYPSDLTAGAAIGQACGLAAVQRGQGDGSDAPWSGVPPTGAADWIPTPPGFVQSPLLPLAGTWQPWHLESGDQMRPSAPNVYADGGFTPAFLQQVQEVAEIHANLTDAQKQIALFWADGAGTVTPPGHWMQFALAHVRSAGYSTPRAARLLALLATGLADSAISCWDCKYAYWVLRPVSAIRNIPNQSFTNPGFLPFIATPPFPAYTSGHSTFSSCAATILEHFFPGGRVPDAFGRSLRFQAAAQQAADSRLYGGIHYRMDSEDGLTGGRSIAQLAIQRARTDGAPTRP